MKHGDALLTLMTSTTGNLLHPRPGYNERFSCVEVK